MSMSKRVCAHLWMVQFILGFEFCRQLTWRRDSVESKSLWRNLFSFNCLCTALLHSFDTFFLFDCRYFINAVGFGGSWCESSFNLSRKVILSIRVSENSIFINFTDEINSKITLWTRTFKIEVIKTSAEKPKISRFFFKFRKTHFELFFFTVKRVCPHLYVICRKN